MKIDDYSFGRITVDGEVFTRDIIIAHERVHSPWRRQRGHELSLDEIDELLDAKPEVVIIGTGSSGMMTVPRPVVEALAESGAVVVVEKTGAAAKIFNREADRRNTVAALHLTC